MNQEVDTLKLQNTSLKEQLKSLRQKHEYTVMELADIKESEQRLRKINDALMKTIEESKIDLKPIKDINLVLEGQFTNQKIAELERELDKYRQGVNLSVDRRVRQIIQGYNDLQAQDRQKSRSIGDSNNVSINYNVVNKRAGKQPCLTCEYLKQLLAQKERMLDELNVDLDELRADNSIVAAKLAKVEALVDTLKQQNKLLQTELARQEYELNQWRESDQTYFDERSQREQSRVSSKTEYREKENMMREIHNIVNGYSSRKLPEDSRTRSRVVAKDSNALFSIKNGINRPHQLFF